MRLLTVARDLRRRKARERTGCFVAEGVRASEELLGSGLVVRGAVIGPQLSATARGEALRTRLRARGIEMLEVGERDFAGATETESPQGVLLIAEIPERTWDAVPADGVRRLLLLDAVQDPGNVGTMVRTAAALGAAATVALPGTVDLWNAKVVRSAMGSLFTHAVFASAWEDFDRWRARHGVGVWAADPAGTALPAVHGEAPARLALIVGNEGSGLTDEARARADRRVALPSGAVESLNVAVAAGILLYELRPREGAPASGAARP